MIELITMGGSSMMGFIFKLIANAQADKARQQEYLLKRAGFENDSANDASKRSSVWMQRFTVLILILLFAVISLGLSQPTNIVTKPDEISFFFGLFTFDREPIIQSVEGAIYTEALTTSILAIVAYLFGVQAGERS